MMRRSLLLTMLLLAAHSATAQSFRERVDRIRDGSVNFHFTARPGVCGDGEHFVRMGHSYFGRVMSDYPSRPCQFGPVQVRITKRDGVIDRVESWVGQLRTREGMDVGAVSAPVAAQYLLDVARTANGTPGSKAIMPAVLADSAIVWPTLLQVARDVTRQHSTRQDASFWLSRFAAARVAGRPNELFDDTDEDDHVGKDDVKTHAVFVMSQLPHSEGIPLLLDAARTNASIPVRNAALFWLGQSNDTRAIDLFESLLRK